MKHEVLLILSGHRSDILWPDSWQVRRDLVQLANLHVADIEVLQHFADLGRAYYTCLEFIDASNYEFLKKHFSKQGEDAVIPEPPLSASRSIVKSPGPGASGTHSTKSHVPAGLYIQALCYGMEDALDGYRKYIMELEQECILDDTLPMSYFRIKLEDVRIYVV